MSGKVNRSRGKNPFEFDFEIVESHSDDPTPVVVPSSSPLLRKSEPPVHLQDTTSSSDDRIKKITPWIEPAKIKLKHRIGRGPFGDVWLATLHLCTRDYDVYHEVAVKMLHPVKEDQVALVLTRLTDLFSKCRELGCVCRPEGFSRISGKLCIVMKLYEGSIGDKMARLECGKLSLHDVLRYGADLAQQILELHSKEILVLNLKPFNFLLDENDHPIIGDIGIPYLLHGISLPGSDMAKRLGTPNYMAPEQWQPEVRGPLTFESDSWGFACSILEMLTGVQPWTGKSVEEIYNCVTRRQQKPKIPDGLPSAIENVLAGCFEYDFRCRPTMKDLFSAFKSSLIASSSGEGLAGNTGSRIISQIPIGNGYSEGLLEKDDLQVGDMVRSRKDSSKPENMEVLAGSIADMKSDRSGFVLVRVHGKRDPVRVEASCLERVTFGLVPGDWVRLKKAHDDDDKNHSPVGILHSITREGRVTVALIGKERLWKGSYLDLQMAETFSVGQFVRLRANSKPRFEWPRSISTAGRICQVLPNGCLIVNFPGKLPLGDDNSNNNNNNGESTYFADPAEVEVVSFNTCPTLVKKYQHLEDFHWAVRPMLLAAIFTAVKMGLFVGSKIRNSKKENNKKAANEQTPKTTVPVPDGDQNNAAWIPPFGE